MTLKCKISNLETIKQFLIPLRVPAKSPFPVKEYEGYQKYMQTILNQKRKTMNNKRMKNK